jgi:hypothetical protein
MPVKSQADGIDDVVMSVHSKYSSQGAGQYPRRNLTEKSTRSVAATSSPGVRGETPSNELSSTDHGGHGHLQERDYRDLSMRRAQEGIPEKDSDNLPGARTAQGESAGNRLADRQLSDRPSPDAALRQSNADSRLWVRIPYPLTSWVSKPIPTQQLQPSQLQPPEHHIVDQDQQRTAVGHMSYSYSVRGWFNLSATQMRELTVESLDQSSDLTEQMRNLPHHSRINED